MGNEPQFEIVCVFKGKDQMYCLCHNKDPLGQCLFCYQEREAVSPLCPVGKTSRTEAEHKAAGQGLVWQRRPSSQ